VVRVLDLDQRRFGDHDLEEAEYGLVQYRARFDSASSSTSGVGATWMSSAIAISGSHGAKSGARVATSELKRSMMAASGSSRPKFRSSRRSSRHSAYGVDAV
jgi:hypothetical protein